MPQRLIVRCAHPIFANAEKNDLNIRPRHSRFNHFSITGQDKKTWVTTDASARRSEWKLALSSRRAAIRPIFMILRIY
jgi:hypothetical protein